MEQMSLPMSTDMGMSLKILATEPMLVRGPNSF